MDRRDEGQMELFSSDGESGQARPSRRDSTFLARVRVYEKTILMLISIFITALVAYTAGMEKGKRNQVMKQAPIAVSRPLAPQASAIGVGAVREPPLPLVMTHAAPTPVPAMQSQPANVAVKKEVSGGLRYTIQLASYKSRSAAQKEGARLKKSGYTVIVVTKGKYSMLCVGNFSSKEKAQALLAEMKNRYNGCFVKKL